MGVAMVIMAMGVALDVDIARHHEDAVPDPHDLDVRTVELRQRQAR